MKKICGHCGYPTKRGKYHEWQIVVAIVGFPIGLLALLVGRRPVRCTQCKRWIQG